MKYKLWKLTLSFALAILASAALAIPALAVPVCQTPRTVEQSCGTPLTIRFLGDEFIHWQETLAGEVIAYNPGTNNWYYAYVDGEYLYPGSEKVRPITPLFGSRADTITAEDMCDVFEAANYYRAQFESRLRPINLTNNRIPLLAILIEFEDRQFSEFYLCPKFPTLTSFWSNQKFGETGKTVNTYFAEASHDFNLQFVKPTFTVSDGFRVENPTPQVSLLEISDGVIRARVNAPHPNTTVDPAAALAPSVHNAFNAVREHLDLSNIPRSPGTNLVQAGTITSENFLITTVIAGYEASATGRQPHINGHARPGSWSIGLDGGLTAYGAVGELSASGIMGIGGTIHEIGHLFGLPDLYCHTPFSAALGRFSVMCFGSHSSLVGQPPGTSPPLLDPWSKIQLGFIEPTVVNVGEHKIVSMYGMDANSPYNVVQVISDVDPDQHFLIENRRTVGFDEPLSRSNTSSHGNIPRGEGGILIYHIDDRVLRDERLGGQRRANVNNNPLHRGVDLEAMMTPSGSLQPADFNPFFVRGGLRYTFNPTTTPNSNFHTPGLCHDHRNGPFNCHPQTVLSNIHIRANDVAGQVVEVEFGTPCPIVAEGRFGGQIGGVKGVYWLLCECGVLNVSEGSIYWRGTASPWNMHRLAINEIVFEGPVIAGAGLRGLFAELSNVTTIEGLEHFDTSGVRDTTHTFSNMHSLTSLDVSNWDMSGVTHMTAMFQNVSSLASLDVSNWDTSNVAFMHGMFSGASSLTSLDVSNWDTGRVTRMDSMFSFASSITELDVSNWDTSNVTLMTSMFSNANSLTDLNLSGWDVGNVTGMSRMFANTHSLTGLNVSGWNTSNARDMNTMFGGTGLTSLDLSNFDTGNVTNMGSIFGGANSLIELDLSNWDTANVTNMNWMFSNVAALRILTLDEGFEFRNLASLPAVRTTTDFTGYWQNVGNGTVEQPNGEHVLTSAQLMAQFDGATMADTWVWQPR